MPSNESEMLKALVFSVDSCLFRLIFLNRNVQRKKSGIGIESQSVIIG